MARNNTDEKSIVKVGGRRENPFVQVDKEIVNNKDLSWAARGLLCYLLSKPGDWKIIIADLIKQSPAGRDAVYSLINELIKHGYIIRETKREKGRFAGYEYIVYEIPVEVTPETQKKPKRTSKANKINASTVSGKTVSGSTVSGKSDTTNKDFTNKDLTNKEIQSVCQSSVSMINTTVEEVAATSELKPKRTDGRTKSGFKDYSYEAIKARSGASDEVMCKAYRRYEQEVASGKVIPSPGGYIETIAKDLMKYHRANPVNHADQKKKTLMRSMYS